jgi:hypothetical protein
MAWQVLRQDDNGNRYVVALLDNEITARALAASLEARAHKQLYEVVQVLPIDPIGIGGCPGKRPM